MALRRGPAGALHHVTIRSSEVANTLRAGRSAGVADSLGFLSAPQRSERHTPEDLELRPRFLACTIGLTILSRQRGTRRFARLPSQPANFADSARTRCERRPLEALGVAAPSRCASSA
eukprot:2181058-Prymnesium_polylepis.2